jgi:hypothetical protein
LLRPLPARRGRSLLASAVEKGSCTLNNQNDGALGPDDLDGIAGGASLVRVGAVKSAGTGQPEPGGGTGQPEPGGTMTPDLSNARVG